MNAWVQAQRAKAGVVLAVALAVGALVFAETRPSISLAHSVVVRGATSSERAGGEAMLALYRTKRAEALGWAAFSAALIFCLGYRRDRAS